MSSRLLPHTACGVSRYGAAPPLRCGPGILLLRGSAAYSCHDIFTSEHNDNPKMDCNFAAMSKVLALYHIVFCTRYRKLTLPDELREEVYRFIWAEIKKHKCHLVRIGGIENHIHMLVELNPDEKLSTLMRDIKANSSGWLHRDERFRYFEGWAREYFAVTINPNSRASVVDYINAQVEHHRTRNFNDELEEMYRMAGVSFDERDLM